VASSRRDTGAPEPSGSMVKRRTFGSCSENDGSNGTAPGVRVFAA
jgi:hypothetical protein